MKIYKDGKEIGTIEEELQKLLDIKKRAENTYTIMLYLINVSNDDKEKLNARRVLTAVGEILGYSYAEIEKDIEKECKKEK